MVDLHWNTRLSYTTEDGIIIRGYDLIQLIGAVPFPSVLYLLFKGDLPEPKIAKLIDALMVASIDHGPGAPSVLAARTAASGGAPLGAAAAAGLLTLNKFHGAAVEDSMTAIQRVYTLGNGEADKLDQAADTMVLEWRQASRRIAGFGHRQHKKIDPRLDRLFELAKEAEVPGLHLEAARNTRMSKTSDFGSGCSADGNLVVEETIYDHFLDQLIKEGGHLASVEEKQKLQAVLWDEEGHRTSDTIAISAQRIANRAGFTIPDDRKFIIVKEDHIGKDYLFSSEKLCVVLAIFKYSGFEDALKMVEQIYEVGGKGHSCGIYSFNDDHINQLALLAPVSRIMVRQAQSKSNAGSFVNGMPMTSSLGCGTWGGNSTSENINLKHYMNVTWVSKPIPEDRPSEAELFGEFYNT